MKGLSPVGVYLIDRYGNIIDCSDLGYHPYIVYTPDEESHEDAITFLFRDFPEQIPWIIKHSSTKTKELFLEALQRFATLFSAPTSFDVIVDLFGTSLDDDSNDFPNNILSILGSYDIFPREDTQNVGQSYYKSAIDYLYAASESFDNEFLRLRMGGKYLGKNIGDAYFRVSSRDGFNWFDIIWEVVRKNQRIINSVSVLRDRESGKTSIEDDFYTVKGIVLDRVKVSDFLTISGKPIIEEYEDRSDDDVSAEIKDILSNLGINREGSYSGDDTYKKKKKNSNDYGAISSLLDSSKDIEQIDETSYLTAENGNLDYRYNDDYMISLIADFDNDYYKLVVTKM